MIEATEAAASTILEAAEAIQAGIEAASTELPQATALREKLRRIFEACAFQDLTSQQIRRAIPQLEGVVAMLRELTPTALTPPGSAASEAKQAEEGDAAALAPLDQAAIDQLLSG